MRWRVREMLHRFRRRCGCRRRETAVGSGSGSGARLSGARRGARRDLRIVFEVHNERNGPHLHENDGTLNEFVGHNPLPHPAERPFRPGEEIVSLVNGLDLALELLALRHELCASRCTDLLGLQQHFLGACERGVTISDHLVAS